MKSYLTIKTLIRTFILFLFLFSASPFWTQEFEEQRVVDVVWLKDGSKLSGTIIKWILAEEMEFQLLTGAVIVIPKSDIDRVMQDIPYTSHERQLRVQEPREPKPYTFREEGWYHNTSGFLSGTDPGGAGLHHVMGFRLNRMLGFGLGMGIETYD